MEELVTADQANAIVAFSIAQTKLTIRAMAKLIGEPVSTVAQQYILGLVDMALKSNESKEDTNLN